MEKNKKQQNENPNTLSYTLVLQTMNSPLSSCFYLDQLVFPPK
jgi:hypothetical protein